MMDNFLNFLQTFFKLFLELTVLFIFISILVSWLQQKVTEDRITRALGSPNKWRGYLYGTGLAGLTPFCCCCSVPFLSGLLSSKAPIGPSMSFLIASPLLNPVIVILLWTLLGWKLTLYYVVIVGIFAVLIGVVWKALGLEHSVKNVNVRKASSQDDNIKKSKWK